MRVVIDARIESSKLGGVETFVKGLIEGFSQNLPKGIEINLLILESAKSLIENNDVGNGIRVITSKYPVTESLLMRKLKTFLRIICFILRLKPPKRFILPRDSVLESLNPDIVHFTFQVPRYTKCCTLFHPHDLQHIHLKSYFSIIQRLARSANYFFMMTYSEFVIVANGWVKQDIINNFPIDASKIKVVELAPLNRMSFMNSTRSTQILKLPNQFLLYPAANWPHKNHLNLFRSIANLKERGIEIQLVCTGNDFPQYPSRDMLAQQFEVSNNVTNLNYVSEGEMLEIYLQAKGIIVPTYFEAGSFPVMEAQSLGKPVACSDIPQLREQVDDSAILFDPYNVISIEESILKLWFDVGICRHLAKLGLERVKDRSWTNTCAEFTKIYQETKR